jgi:hypothetical protein
LAVIAIEFIWLCTRGSWAARDAALRLGPAVLMMLALRVALTGGAWTWVALFLALSFPIHLADLRRR